jgi:hypothetical protein
MTAEGRLPGNRRTGLREAAVHHPRLSLFLTSSIPFFRLFIQNLSSSFRVHISLLFK